MSRDEAYCHFVGLNPNKPVDKIQVSIWAILLGQFKNFLITVLLMVVALLASLGWVTNAASWIGDLVHSLSECGGFCRLYLCWSFRNPCISPRSPKTRAGSKCQQLATNECYGTRYNRHYRHNGSHPCILGHARIGIAYCFCLSGTSRV